MPLLWLPGVTAPGAVVAGRASPQSPRHGRIGDHDSSSARPLAVQPARMVPPADVKVCAGPGDAGAGLAVVDEGPPAGAAAVVGGGRLSGAARATAATGTVARGRPAGAGAVPGAAPGPAGP